MRTLALITPDWPAPPNVRAAATTCAGGVSEGVYASLNLGTHVGDDAGSVRENRRRLEAALGVEPLWLEQVHGVAVADTAFAEAECAADASVAHAAGRACLVMTADCLPVLFCSRAGDAVGAAHAGWRGLAGGVLENTVAALGCAPGQVMAWLGPAISQPVFEVGEEVREAFVTHLPATATAFLPGRVAGKWQADLYALARLRLAAIGVSAVYGGGRCTFSEAGTFFSARRDGTQSGRQASLVWLDA